MGPAERGWHEGPTGRGWLGRTVATILKQPCSGLSFMKELCPKEIFFITTANEVNLHLPLQEEGFRWTDCLPGEITCFATVIIAKQANNRSTVHRESSSCSSRRRFPVDFFITAAKQVISPGKQSVHRKPSSCSDRWRFTSFAAVMK